MRKQIIFENFQGEFAFFALTSFPVHVQGRVGNIGNNVLQGGLLGHVFASIHNGRHEKLHDSLILFVVHVVNNVFTNLFVG